MQNCGPYQSSWIMPFKDAYQAHMFCTFIADPLQTNLTLHEHDLKGL